MSPSWGANISNLYPAGEKIKGKIIGKFTERFSRGSLQFFSPRENQQCWRLLNQKTFEHLTMVSNSSGRSLPEKE
jgi:hypothetical protein